MIDGLLDKKVLSKPKRPRIVSKKGFWSGLLATHCFDLKFRFRWDNWDLSSRFDFLLKNLWEIPYEKSLIINPLLYTILVAMNFQKIPYYIQSLSLWDFKKSLNIYNPCSYELFFKKSLIIYNPCSNEFSKNPLLYTILVVIALHPSRPSSITNYQLPIHNSQFQAKVSLRETFAWNTIHNSQFTIHNSQFTITQKEY